MHHMSIALLHSAFKLSINKANYTFYDKQIQHSIECIAHSCSLFCQNTSPPKMKNITLRPAGRYSACNVGSSEVWLKMLNII